MSWQGSNRRAELPADWHKLRLAVLERDLFMCVWPMSTGLPCAARATDVDHIERGNDHSMTNLRALCSWHHKQKTAREGAAARPRLTSKRPPPKHPGMR